MNWKIRIKLNDGEDYTPYVDKIKSISECNTLIVKENVNDKERYYPHIQGMIVSSLSERKLRSIIKSLFDSKGNQKYSLANKHDDWKYYQSYLVKNINHTRYKTEILFKNNLETDIDELYKYYLSRKPISKSRDMTREEALFSDLNAYLSSFPHNGNKRTLLRHIVQYYKDNGKVLHKIEIARLLETYVNYTQGVSEEWIDSVLLQTAYYDEIHRPENCTRCYAGVSSFIKCERHRLDIDETD